MADQKCSYCFHDDHGTARHEMEFMFTNSRREGLCNEPVNDFGRFCNCDGRTQWWQFKGDTPEIAAAQAKKAEAAGYERYEFDSGKYTVQPIDEDGNKRGYWISAVFSDKLPPVADRKEFEQRIGL